MQISNAFKDANDAKNRFLILYGGAGSGKSFFVTQKILLRIVSESNHRILVVRKTANTLNRSVIQLFKDIIDAEGLGGEFVQNKTERTLRFKRTKSEILFTGLDDPEKLKSIAGVTSIWVEEATELDESDINELNRRLRGFMPYYKQIILTFNPTSDRHWIKKRFFDNRADDAKTILSTYKNNPFLDSEYKEELEKLKLIDPEQYKIYTLGVWGSVGGMRVYNHFTEENVCAPFNMADMKIHAGVDFNIGGCAIVYFVVKDNVVYVVDYKSAFDTYDIINTVKNDNPIVYPDASSSARNTSSTTTDKELLQNAGLYVDAPKSNPAIQDRVNAVNKLFIDKRLYVFSTVYKVINALKEHRRDNKGYPIKYDSHEGGSIDDINDAIGYFVHRKFPITHYAKVQGGFSR